MRGYITSNILEREDFLQETERAFIDYMLFNEWDEQA